MNTDERRIERFILNSFYLCPSVLICGSNLFRTF
jgi:hypothetical protein